MVLVESLTEEIEIQEGADVRLDKHTLIVKGPKGEISRKFLWPRVVLEIKDNKVVLSSSKPSRREKRMINTFRAILIFGNLALVCKNDCINKTLNTPAAPEPKYIRLLFNAGNAGSI